MSFTPQPLGTPVTGQTISASVINAILYALQRPTGQQEVVKYFVYGAGYVNNAVISAYARTTSRFSTPVSCTLDISDSVPVQLNQNPTANHLTSGGVQVYALAKLVNSASAGGQAFIQY